MATSKKANKAASKDQDREKTRTTLILYSDTQKKVRMISVMDEVEITDIVEDALSEYISKWEKKNGELIKK